MLLRPLQPGHLWAIGSEGKGLLDVHCCILVPESKKGLNRELVNKVMRIGTCTLQRTHLELPLRVAEHSSQDRFH